MAMYSELLGSSDIGGVSAIQGVGLEGFTAGFYLGSNCRRELSHLHICRGILSGYC